MYSSINLIQQVAKFILWKPGIEQNFRGFFREKFKFYLDEAGT